MKNLLFLCICFLFVGCGAALRKIDARGAPPHPVFHLERELHTNEILVYKYAIKGPELAVTNYWHIVTVNLHSAKWFRELHYGELPVGYRVVIPAKPLDVGLYEIFAGSATQAYGLGAFVVLRESDNKLNVLSVHLAGDNKRYRNIMKCMIKYSYSEKEVKENCVKKKDVMETSGDEDPHQIDPS